ncbi:MAG: carbohydrate ABC transporter permease [Lachnospiraceae bacterium]|nr:carbohydrate ABC transporter permease [Lachnospiraceae bacterium]
MAENTKKEIKEREEKKVELGANIFLCIMSLLILSILLFPIFWILNTSLKTETEIFANPPTFYPHVLNLKSYAAQVEIGDFNMFRSFLNSFCISFAAMGISVVLSVPAAYGIAQYHFKGRNAMLLGFLVTQMLPVSVLLTPMFIMFRNIHLYNTWGSAILADATIGIPFSVLILKNYFAAIPRDLEEAGYIDGCSRFGAFFRIMVPITRPGIMVCAIFSFLYAWGDLAYGMTFILDQKKRPITAGIFNFLGQYGTKWSYLSAFAIVTIIPVALIFIFMQKYIIAGMTRGAVKG